MSIILSNRLYVPRHQVSEVCLDEWTYDIGDDEDFHTILTYQNMGEYVGLHRGDLKKIQKYFDLSNITDQRSLVKFDEEIKFTGLDNKGLGTLRKEQKEVLIEFLKNGPGVVQAPPRWGKTIWVVALITCLKQKTLFMAHEISLLQQMEEEFRKWTNINELEEKLGYKLIGILKDIGTPGNWEEPFPVLTLSTYQKFIRPNGQAWLFDHRDAWGLVGIDECHRVTSQCYTDVTSKLNSYYRLGLTATPYHSKSELHCIEFDVLGPVVAVGTTEQLAVDLIEHKTQYKVEKFDRWDQLVKQLVEDQDRNLEICKWIIKDVRDGHKVIVTTDRQIHPNLLKEMLFKLDPDITVAIVSGKVTGKPRERIRHKIKNREYDVTIAMNRIVQMGWNIPAWSSLHNTLPMTSPENWYQRISRIRTPDPDHEKLQPICRVYTSKNNWMPCMRAYLNTVDDNAKKCDFSWLPWGEQQLPVDLKDLTVKEIESW